LGVHGARAHQHVGDFQRLLAGVRLGDEELVDLHAELLRVLGIERVLRVDEGGGSAGLLHLRDHRKRQRGLAGRLRPVDLDHAAAGQAAHAQRDIKAERPGRHHLNVLQGARVHAHDGALAVLLFDLRQSRGECLGFVVIHLCFVVIHFLCIPLAADGVLNGSMSPVVDLYIHTGC
jgi:hypothetical protein